MTAFTNYAMMAVFPIMMLAMILNFVIRASASAQRIDEVLKTEPVIKEKPGALSPPDFDGRIEFRDVCFRYGDADYALENISLSIKPGEKIGIIGPTGSGKSTVAHLIGRYYDVSSGQVLLDGNDVRELTFDTIRGNTVIALQETVLFTGTIEENIRFGKPDAAMEEVEEAARLACAYQFITEKEKGWGEPVGERGTGLSGGQRQRVALARALLVRPKILILDDVTSALDAATERRVIENLYNLRENPTLIIISQKINPVRRADRIFVLDEGRIAAEGAHDDLLDCCPVYREIEETQNADADFDEADELPGDANPATAADGPAEAQRKATAADGVKGNHG
jgi:ATP-binding cassette subfamily B protein